MSKVRLQHSKRSFSIFVIITLIFVSILFIQIAGAAFVRLGIHPWLALIIVPGSLIGSMVNIPAFKVASEEKRCEQEYVTFFGLSYRVVPSDCSGETQINVNLGGAIIPVLVSGYLLITNVDSILPAIVGIVIVSVIVKSIARVKPEVGIVTPGLLPPLISAIVAILLVAFFGMGLNAYVLAYVSGTLGTLIGADLLNIPNLGELQTDEASIGGAGTWDGIFLSGLLAVFLV